MSRTANDADVWESRRVKQSRSALKRLLISLPLFAISITVKQCILPSTVMAVWIAWFMSSALGILACVFAAESAYCVKNTDWTDETALIVSLAKAVLWSTVFWIGYLAFSAFQMITK